MKRVNLWFVACAGLALLGCGGDDDGGGGGGGGSFGAISKAIAAPTGTVDAMTAPAIADEYEKISGANPGGTRFAQSESANQTMACPSGGNIQISASGNQSSARARITYNDCCYDADCCYSGDADWYYSTESGAEYGYCGSYDLSTSCFGSSANFSYEGCFSLDGSWVYVVEVDGDTFAVTGSYNSGNGTLEINGENGSFSCTYTNGSGSCSGAGTFSF